MMTTKPNIPPLNYASPPPVWRRKRFRRLMMILAAGFLAYFAYSKGPGAWHRTWAIYYQHVCVSFAPGPEVVVIDDSPNVPVNAPLPKGYVLAKPRKFATDPLLLEPESWVAFDAAAMRDQQSLGVIGAVVYVGERENPAGEKRICVISTGGSSLWGFGAVVLDAFSLATSSDYAGLSHASRLLDPWDFVPSDRIDDQKIIRVWAGQSDPIDKTHFSVEFETKDAKRHLLDCWLLRDGRISEQVRDLPAKPSDSVAPQ